MAKYSNLNPQTISDMSIKELRSTYSELRSIARKRMDRLEAAGFPTQKRFAPLTKLDSADLEPELERLAFFLQSPGSRVITARKEQEQIKIVARGYNIEDFNDFGDFMDVIRYRFKGRKLSDSDPYVQIYDAAEKRNMTWKTLSREFGKYLNYVQSAEVLKDALNKAPMASEKHAFLTAKDLSDILEKRNIDAVYNKAVEAERERKAAERRAEKDRRAAERSKAKGKSGKKK